MPSRAPVFRAPAQRSRAEVQRDYDRGRNPEDYDRPWRRCRDAFAAKHPLCCRCLQGGRVTPMREVHHIRSVRSAPELRLDWSNLMSLCHACHMQIEADARAVTPPGRRSASG